MMELRKMIVFNSLNQSSKCHRNQMDIYEKINEGQILRNKT